MSAAEKTTATGAAANSNSRWHRAVDYLEQAARLGKSSDESNYLLAMCFKRQQKFAEARAALRKIKSPDANIHLQMGVLSFSESQFEQAAQEFAKSVELEPKSAAAAYNLLMCRILLGQFETCAPTIASVIELLQGAKERRFLSLVEALLVSSYSAEGPLPVILDDNNGRAEADSPNNRSLLAGMTAEEERRLLGLLQGVPKFESTFPVLQRLAQVRPHSKQIQQTWMETVLVQAKKLANRCMWSDADELLSPLARLIETSPAILGHVPQPVLAAYWNLLGCCATMTQDFPRAIRCFSTAIKMCGNNAWLYQNLALAYEFQGRMDQAEIHWNRYFDLLNNEVPTPAIGNYLDDLAVAGLNRLSEHYNKLEKWSNALNYIQRANQLRPHDLDTLDRMFNLYLQVRRPDDARRTLDQMRALKPGDPQFDLYELDIREVRSLEDIDRMLTDIKQILTRHPSDLRVEDRAFGMVVNCMPMINQRCDQLSEQLSNIVEQVRRLPNYQINWPVVHDEMHFLRHEFQKLRRLSNKCLALVTLEEQRRAIRDLNALIDSRIDVCIQMGG